MKMNALEKHIYTAAFVKEFYKEKGAGPPPGFRGMDFQWDERCVRKAIENARNLVKLHRSLSRKM